MQQKKIKLKFNFCPKHIKLQFNPLPTSFAPTLHRDQGGQMGSQWDGSLACWGFACTFAFATAVWPWSVAGIQAWGRVQNLEIMSLDTRHPIVPILPNFCACWGPRHEDFPGFGPPTRCLEIHDFRTPQVRQPWFSARTCLLNFKPGDFRLCRSHESKIGEN